MDSSRRHVACDVAFTQVGHQHRILQIRRVAPQYYRTKKDGLVGLQVGIGHEWLPLRAWLDRHYGKAAFTVDDAHDVGIITFITASYAN
jgi:hypothetical protein